MKSPKYLGLWLGLLASLSLHGQNVRGRILSEKGEALPFASIWASGSQHGALANEEGQFIINLKPGKHDLVFRFLGYEPQTKSIELNDKDLAIEVRLKEQTVALKEVQIAALKEDPAIGIMRRMIAMAPYHLKEIASYKSKAYVKGSGKITSMSKMANALIGKALEKQASIKIGKTYLLENLNELEYRKPGKYSERVMASKNNLPSAFAQSGDVNLRITQTNFYQPRLYFGSYISPLAPAAFSYYDFAYLGSFSLNGQNISKIRVKPKRASEDLLDGELQVVEDTWSIYSLDFLSKQSGNTLRVKVQNFLVQGVWVPVQYDLNLSFEQLGVQGFIRYLTQIKDLKLVVDPAFVVKPTVIEERLEKSLAKEIDQKKMKTVGDAKQALQGELTRKKLKQALKKIEKEERKQMPKEEGLIINYDYAMEMDSSARMKAEDFWEKEREMPLVAEESKAYVEADSIYRAGAEKRRKDSINNLPRFKFLQLISGKRYDYRKKQLGHLFELSSIKTFLTPVDGQVVAYKLNWSWDQAPQDGWRAQLDLRYGIKRQGFNPNLRIERLFNQGRQRIILDGGSQILQLNQNDPIAQNLENTFNSVFSINNAKWFRREHIQLAYRHRITAPILLSSSLETQWRSPMSNVVDRGYFRTSRLFKPNVPEIEEAGSLPFEKNQQHRFYVGLQYQPKAVASRYNKRLFLRNANDLIFNLGYQLAWGDLGFQKIYLQAKQSLDLDRLGSITYAVQYNLFIQNPSMYLDYTYFNGNELRVLSSQSSDLYAFRLLPFYRYSTSNDHFLAHLQWEPRRFVLSNIPFLYQYGIRERIHYSYLQIQRNPSPMHYQEISYGIDGIVAGFGLELAYPLSKQLPQQMRLMIRLPF